MSPFDSNKASPRQLETQPVAMAPRADASSTSVVSRGASSAGGAGSSCPGAGSSNAGDGNSSASSWETGARHARHGSLKAPPLQPLQARPSKDEGEPSSFDEGSSTASLPETPPPDASASPLGPSVPASPLLPPPAYSSASSSDQFPTARTASLPPRPVVPPLGPEAAITRVWLTELGLPMTDEEMALITCGSSYGPFDEPEPFATSPSLATAAQHSVLDALTSVPQQQPTDTSPRSTSATSPHRPQAEHANPTKFIYR